MFDTKNPAGRRPRGFCRIGSDRYRLRRARILIAMGTAVLITTSVALGADETAPAPARQRELIQLLRQDCGSCHGLTLQGGLGSALTPRALAGKSAAMLRDVILNGRAGTPMAPWRPFLNQAEATWLVEQMRNGVPNAR